MCVRPRAHTSRSAVSLRCFSFLQACRRWASGQHQQRHRQLLSCHHQHRSQQQLRSRRNLLPLLWQLQQELQAQLLPQRQRQRRRWRQLQMLTRRTLRSHQQLLNPAARQAGGLHACASASCVFAATPCRTAVLCSNACHLLHCRKERQHDWLGRLLMQLCLAGQQLMLYAVVAVHAHAGAALATPWSPCPGAARCMLLSNSSVVKVYDCDMSAVQLAKQLLCYSVSPCCLTQLAATVAACAAQHGMCA